MTEEFFGRFPIRRELTVLPPDDPSKPKRTFVIRNGTEIGRLVNGVLDETPLCRREDLEEGMAIVVLTLVGHYNAIVAKDTDGELYWRASEHFTGNLEFDSDDRHCWTSSAAFNTRGLKKPSAILYRCLDCGAEPVLADHSCTCVDGLPNTDLGLEALDPQPERPQARVDADLDLGGQEPNALPRR